MVKKGSRIHYGYNGEDLSIKQIYSRNKKRRGRSRYLLSVDVTVGEIPAKICPCSNCLYQVHAAVSCKTSEWRKPSVNSSILLDEMEDISFLHSLQIILEALIATVVDIFHISDAQLEEFTVSFVSRLPKYMQDSLRKEKIPA